MGKLKSVKECTETHRFTQLGSKVRNQREKMGMGKEKEGRWG